MSLVTREQISYMNKLGMHKVDFSQHRKVLHDVLTAIDSSKCPEI